MYCALSRLTFRDDESYPQVAELQPDPWTEIAQVLAAAQPTLQVAQ